jgi:hypothetical protein
MPFLHHDWGKPTLCACADVILRSGLNICLSCIVTEENLLFAHALTSCCIGAGGSEGFLLQYTLQPHHILRCDQTLGLVNSPPALVDWEELSLRSFCGRGLWGLIDPWGPHAQKYFQAYGGTILLLLLPAPTGPSRGNCPWNQNLGVQKCTPPIFFNVGPGNIASWPAYNVYKQGCTISSVFWVRDLHNNASTQCISQQCYSARNVTYYLLWLLCPGATRAHPNHFSSNLWFILRDTCIVLCSNALKFRR